MYTARIDNVPKQCSELLYSYIIGIMEQKKWARILDMYICSIILF